MTDRIGAPGSTMSRREEDSTDLAPAERHTIEFTADAEPGIYPMHCHKVNHVMNGSTYPGGMLGGVVYEDAMSTDNLAELMEYAGYQV